jgi:hypothetical protein
VKKHYVAVVRSVVGKKKIVLRKDLKDRPCKAQFCGPQDHIVHWSQDLNEVCVPLWHGLLGERHLNRLADSASLCDQVCKTEPHQQK